LKASKPNAQIKTIVKEAIQMSQAAAKANHFTEALSLLGSVDAVLRRAADGTALKPRVAEARAAISTREKDWKSYQAAVSKIAEKPDDPAANLAVGRWHLVQDADWAKALPFLAKGGDPKWRAAVALRPLRSRSAMHGGMSLRRNPRSSRSCLRMRVNGTKWENQN
jgi:hypothetical protein